eukprot:scaffold1774_cov121-Isochrysis_galbana.AAC.9
MVAVPSLTASATDAAADALRSAPAAASRTRESRDPMQLSSVSMPPVLSSASRLGSCAMALRRATAAEAVAVGSSESRASTSVGTPRASASASRPASRRSSDASAPAAKPATVGSSRAPPSTSSSSLMAPRHTSASPAATECAARLPSAPAACAFCSGSAPASVPRQFSSALSSRDASAAASAATDVCHVEQRTGRPRHHLDVCILARVAEAVDQRVERALAEQVGRGRCVVDRRVEQAGGRRALQTDDWPAQKCEERSIAGPAEPELRSRP